VADAALVICALAGHDPEDPGSVEISGAELNPEQANAARLRVGYPHAYVRARSDAAVAAVTEQVVARLRKQGLPVTEIDFPDFPHVRTVSLTIQMPEVLSYHRRFLPDRLHLYSPELRGGLAFGQFILAEHYVRALRMVEHYRRVLARTFTEIDILLLPTTPVTAPPIGTEVLSIGGSTEPLGDVLTRFTALFNMTGNPALAMPCGQDENGLPFSVQLVGRPYEDAFVLAVGEMMEAELGLLWASTYFDGGG
jgi:aspartyl-tRNA(Asn)/glutamyl-tRNA(Gln) amidotransferase subunit A